MMPSAGQLFYELERAEKELYRMMEEHFVAARLAGQDLQESLTGTIREQRIIVAWLRAEYTGRLLHGLHEKIGEAEGDVLLGDSGPGAREKIEADRREFGKLRSRHLDAYNLLATFEGWKEVVERYERRMGR